MPRAARADEEGTLTAGQVAERTEPLAEELGIPRITPDVLRIWHMRGRFHASAREGAGPGRWALNSFDDLIKVQVVQVLRRYGDRDGIHPFLQAIDRLGALADVEGHPVLLRSSGTGSKVQVFDAVHHEAKLAAAALVGLRVDLWQLIVLAGLRKDAPVMGREAAEERAAARLPELQADRRRAEVTALESYIAECDARIAAAKAAGEGGEE